MAKKKYIIFDIGASSGRAIVARYNGETFKINEIYRFKNIPIIQSGRLYWDIPKLFSEIIVGVAIGIKKYRNLNSIGFTTFGIDFGFIGRNGQLLSNPVHYRDTSRIKTSEKLYNEIISKEKLFKLNGGLISEIASINHLYSLKIQGASELINADSFLMFPDILNYLISGVKNNEYTSASTTTLFNYNHNDWERDLLKKMGIPDNLFRYVTMPGKKIGNLSNSLAREVEAKPLNVISVSSHDTASAFAGIPYNNKDKLSIFISTGTWFTIGLNTEKIITTDLAFRESFYNEGGPDGSNLFMKDLTGFWIIQQCRNKWIKDLRRNIEWNEIINQACSAKPFRSFIDINNPAFSEPLLDMTLVISKYCKDKNQQVPVSIGEYSRCIYESMVFKLIHVLKIIEKVISKRIEIAYLIGGGAQNSLLCQWISDATNLPIYAGPAESASIGNLIFQLIANREITNIEEGKRICKLSFTSNLYEPKNYSIWNEEYIRYQKIINR